MIDLANNCLEEINICNSYRCTTSHSNYYDLHKLSNSNEICDILYLKKDIILDNINEKLDKVGVLVCLNYGDGSLYFCDNKPIKQDMQNIFECIINSKEFVDNNISSNYKNFIVKFLFNRKQDVRTNDIRLKKKCNINNIKCEFRLQNCKNIEERSIES